MYQCYATNESIKAFCDDIHMLGYQGWTKDEELLKCYNQFKNEKGSDIKDKAITDLEKKIECDTKETALEKYQCLDIPTSKIDFCYDTYKIDLKLSTSKEAT